LKKLVSLKLPKHYNFVLSPKSLEMATEFEQSSMGYWSWNINWQGRIGV